MCWVSSCGAILQTGHRRPDVDQQLAEEGAFCDYCIMVPFDVWIICQQPIGLASRTNDGARIYRLTLPMSHLPSTVYHTLQPRIWHETLRKSLMPC